MSVSWRFTPKMKDEKTRNPVSGEFFAQDAIRNAGEALIREAIQNSLDARPDRQNGKARVRIYISGPTTGLRPETHSKWFGSAWDHYLAPKNGLRPGLITKSKSCGYLVFEDFGTSGLTGDWKQVDVIDGVRNSFFYFFRAEGATEKASDQLGRWGIGKQVFPRSSNAQTLFGFSVTDEHPNGFLLGSCILKYHEVGGRMYRPDGYFGATVDVGEGQRISVPTQDKGLIESFRTDFNLRRASGQNGLSVIVPWLDEGEDGAASGFNKDSLLSAILDGYFLPILEGKLEVELEDEHRSIRIKADNFSQVLEELLGSSSKDDERRNKGLRRTKALVDLVTSSKSGNPLIFELSPCPITKANWTDEMLPEETARAIRTALTDGRTVKVKASLTVRPKSGEDIQDTFWCLLHKEDGLNERPCHIREDLIISSVSAGRTNGFAAIVRIDKGALANLLGDSENPAHTEWQPSSHNFKDKYTLGGVTIKFVSDFPSELLRRVFSSADQLDKDILRSWFNDPGPEKQDEKVKPRPKEAVEEDKDGDQVDPIDIEPSHNSIQITPLKNGFTVSSSKWDLTQGGLIEIQAAYETAKGNPFKSYKPYDFDFASKAMKPDVTGCIIVEAKEKKLIIEVKSAEFSVTVAGFDVNRDLVVRANPLKPKELS
jgi:hypothetical protein